MLIHLHVISDCFFTAVIKLNSCDRYHIKAKLKITVWLFTECWPPTHPLHQLSP